MLVGIDDTDSPKGGCTTHFALEAAAEFRRRHGLVLRSRARLVRLNPNIPWKTRGNAAVALEFGKPQGGASTVVGKALDGSEILLDPASDASRGSEAHVATLDRLVEAWCDLKAQGTDPAFVIADTPLPERLYHAAVKGVVDPEDVRREFAAMQKAPLWKALGDGRGIVGASAAIGFRPREPTYEWTVYRTRDRWGTKRHVSFGSAERMDRNFPSTFHNVDRRNKHAALAPATPCPVLFGVRAVSLDELGEATRSVDAGEAWGGWMLFETNQGTDAHVVETALRESPPLSTVRVEGEVVTAPSVGRGGHVVFAFADRDGSRIDCAAYEPTKEFRRVVERLAPGDRIRAQGALRDDRATLNLEKMEVLSTAPRVARLPNPKCPSCSRTMKSAGASGPFRCPSCKAKLPRSRAAATSKGPAPALGWHEVPISARRHLAKPIDPHGY